MDLIIVESPTKARTLSKFLKGKYTVEASIGHIRDLPKADLGVDVEHEFAPRYVIPTDKKKRVGELRDIALKADHVILATDPDREGEAIAWHISEILKEKPKKKTKKSEKKEVVPFKRIVFHEITESAIKEALEHPRTVDMKLVDAQQARRILDRLVGYKLSPLLWHKLSKRWLSAGRVQSVAVRLIVEREREIEKFAKQEYWTIEGAFAAKDAKKEDHIMAALASKDGVKYEKTIAVDLFDGTYTTNITTITTKAAADAIIADAQKPFIVTAVDTKQTKRHPSAPYTTSTLQQDAGRRLYFSSKKTMQVAQKLYEEGLITYHRTDSVNLSEKFLTEAREFISMQYGKNYLPEEAKRFQTKSKVAQEAHEAIRPSNINLHDEFFPTDGDLNRDHARLYDLIWKRAVASQAREALFDSTTLNIQSANTYAFEAQGSVIAFDGYLKIIGRDVEDKMIPRVAVGETVNLANIQAEQHTSNPPPRYTEASLVKTLEEKDIGRPSTYAPIISTIQDRQYVIREEKKLLPTELGKSVTDFLVKYFPDIMELPFTAGLEAQLDAVANGQTAWVPVIGEFYRKFAVDLEASYEKAQRVKVAEEELEEPCPQCQHTLVIRVGRYGKFIACSTFPTCKYTRQYAEKIDMKCPRCQGDIVIKKTRTNKVFYGCSNYPTCNFAAWKKEEIK